LSQLPSSLGGVTERWNAAKRHELTKIYNARLGIRITASVDARLRQLALIRRRRLSHVLDDVLDAALPPAEDLTAQLARTGKDTTHGRA
jgi:hypothetical protein